MAVMCGWALGPLNNSHMSSFSKVIRMTHLPKSCFYSKMLFGVNKKFDNPFSDVFNNVCVKHFHLRKKPREIWRWSKSMLCFIPEE